MVVLGTKSIRFMNWRKSHTKGSHNGAYYYAKEIEDIILPKIRAKVFIVTAGGTLYSKNEIPNHAVVVCHTNKNPENAYSRLFKKNILWICSKESTVKRLNYFKENAIYIPLSIDTEYVKSFKTNKTKDIAFVGNKWSYKDDYIKSLGDNIDQLSDIPREELLSKMAEYKTVIADGRCLLEAKALGAKTLIPQYDTFETIDRKLLDSRDTIKMWSKVLNKHSRETPNRFLIAIKSFRDLEAGKMRQLNEVFSVNKARAEELTAHKAKIVRYYTAQ